MTPDSNGGTRLLVTCTCGSKGAGTTCICVPLVKR